MQEPRQSVQIIECLDNQTLDNRGFIIYTVYLVRRSAVPGSREWHKGSVPCVMVHEGAWRYNER